MRLHPPFVISARLMPAVKVEQNGITHWISIKFDGESEGRVRYRYYIDMPGIEHTGNDLRSGVGGGTLQQGMASLLTFLSACGESIRYRGRGGGPAENTDLFPPVIAEWAAQHSDEINMLLWEVEGPEGGPPLIEDEPGPDRG